MTRAQGASEMRMQAGLCIPELLILQPDRPHLTCLYQVPFMAPIRLRHGIPNAEESCQLADALHTLGGPPAILQCYAAPKVEAAQIIISRYC